MSLKRLSAWLVVAAIVAPRVAFADTPATLSAPASEEKKEFGGMVDGRIGIGQIDEDLFLSVNIGTVLTWWKLGVGVQVPLRFRVQDNDPQQDGVFRKEEWDEVSDWTRVVRFISWGKEGEWLYVRLGVLEGTTLGHGTIVDRYMNVIDADHYQTGLQVEVDLDKGGGEFFLDNIIDPEIFGIRGFVRPFQLWDGAPELSKTVEVGLTLADDTHAPLYVNKDQDGFRETNEDGDLLTTESNAFLIGVDLSWLWQPIDWYSFKPYTDLNFLTQTGGVGYHLGVANTFDIQQVVTGGLRVEYRVATADYSPGYINSWYDVERLDYRDDPTPPPPIPGRPVERVTKLDFYSSLDEAGTDDARHGWHADLNINIMEVFTIWGLLEDMQGVDNTNLTIGISLPYIAGVRTQLYYAKRNFDDADEAFDLDRGLLVADFRYKFWGPMFVYATYSREWRLDQEAGQYETINDWDTGVGAEFTF